MNIGKKKVPDFIAGMQTWFMVEFIDEGIDKAVNNMVEKAGINTLLIGTNLDCTSTKNFGELAHNPKRKGQICDGFFKAEWL